MIKPNQLTHNDIGVKVQAKEVSRERAEWTAMQLKTPKKKKNMAGKAESKGCIY